MTLQAGNGKFQQKHYFSTLILQTEDMLWLAAGVCQRFVPVRKWEAEGMHTGSWEHNGAQRAQVQQGVILLL